MEPKPALAAVNSCQRNRFAGLAVFLISSTAALGLLVAYFYKKKKKKDENSDKQAEMVSKAAILHRETQQKHEKQQEKSVDIVDSSSLLAKVNTYELTAVSISHLLLTKNVI